MVFIELIFNEDFGNPHVRDEWNARRGSGSSALHQLLRKLLRTLWMLKNTNSLCKWESPQNSRSEWGLWKKLKKTKKKSFYSKTFLVTLTNFYAIFRILRNFQESTERSLVKVRSQQQPKPKQSNKKALLLTGRNWE